MINVGCVIKRPKKKRCVVVEPFCETSEPVHDLALSYDHAQILTPISFLFYIYITFLHIIFHLNNHFLFL